MKISNKTFEEDFKQLEFCRFKDVLGHKLELNVSYINLKKNAIDKAKVEEAIIDFNSTPNVWSDSLVSDKAFRKLLKDLGLK